MNFSRDMKSLKNRRKGKAGFTMSELLIVVAIVIVLFAVAVLSLVAIQKNLRQKELDSKAEILYVAAQNRMSELRAGGYESLYQYDENKDNGVAKVGLIPLDAPEEDAKDAITKDTLCYVVSADRVTAGKAAASVLPESSVDAELWNNHWVIEYDPESGSVYGAFYSEEEITSGDASTTLPTYLNRMRVRQTRLHNGAKIGYYGGARVISGTTDTLKPDISIDNREKLTATFYCNNPYADELTFNIKVSDGQNEYVKVVKYSELRQLNSKTWYYTWVMDSLESEKTRFYNQTDHKLACGTDITVTLSVESQNANVDGKSYTRKTNSLFRYAESTPAGTALIAYGRHLQNLDEASHVSDTITGAVQVSDLSFADDTADNEDWYSFYGDTFTPITNKNLKSYDGYSEVDNVKLYSSISNLHITKAAQNGDAGLFSTFNGEIKNVTLTGMKIDGGQNVGALIGSVADTVKITNTRVYLSSKKGDLADIETVDSPEKVRPWLEGKVVGGLIGMVTKTGSVSVTDSSASTVIRADGAAGGLIGAVYNAATITDSYADCYLTADRTGGLIAKAEGGSEVAATGTSITLKDFYAAGYQTATVDAFGLVGGSNVIATGGYSACVYNVEENAKVHSTVNAMGSASNVYYLTDGGLSGDGTSKWENDKQTKPKTYKELSESGFAKGISKAFTSSSGAATFPYNLMDQGLTYYTYPRLEKLNHYGDWQAEFESGALVYYERYEDETYGFYGANLSTLKTSKFVVGDGYALAYIEKKDATDNVTVTYANDQPVRVLFDSAIETTDDTTNTKYYLYPLSKEVVNTNYIDTAEPDTFYQKITIEDTANNTNTEYYYNPHFAKTVTVNENKPQAPETVCIRSARQLYALSLYYPQYADAVKDSVFRQELNIDYSRYEWTKYDVVPAKISTQAPIGTGDKPFTAVYNGGCNTIEGISFKAKSLYIGMFGYTSSAAAVRNVFLVGDGSNTVAYVNAQGGNSASGSASRVSIGVLVGYNRGTVSNCSVSGYTMEYYGYSASTASLGGFVGSNYGTIRNSASDCPSIRFANTNSNTYAGGFAGVNHASISDSYALGSVQVRGARNSTVWIAGFAANNASGMIRRSYSATALTASGDAESYGFAHTGGSAYQCYYLDGGTYSYRGTLYAYNTSTNEFEDNAAGEPLTGSELQNKTINNFKKADCTYNFKETTGDSYIYPAVVRNAVGKTVHYGDWPVQKDIGTLGVFYWEYEDSGSNSGYHFSYVGTSQGNEISSANNDILKGDSLCEEHDDGGVVTHYGYGYFYANSNNLETSLSGAVNFNETFMRVAENAKAGEALGKQMPGYTFVTYETGEDKMYLTGSKANGTWQLKYGNGTDATVYTYTVNPFFANSMSLDSSEVQNKTTKTGDVKPGTNGNAYEIRSVSQLQFINWNYGALDATTSILSPDWEKATIEQARNANPNRSYYTYLVYGEKDWTVRSLKYCWVQSHDVNASTEYAVLKKVNNFTPIGSMFDVGGNDRYAKPLMAYFTSSFDGQAYAIKNITIRSKAECVGIFGITSGAVLKNIIVYSDNGSEIEATKEGRSWYCVGGLVGFAGSRDKKESAFTNCTVSGYTIRDNHENNPGWGGGNVGGLVGMTNMNITNCSAVTDIIINIGYNGGYQNLRVGGIAGVSRGTVNYCYAGGSMSSISSMGYKNWNAGANIWMGGLVGGIVLRNDGLDSLIGTVKNVMRVYNSYSYVDMPRRSGGQWGEKNIIKSTQAIASNGEMQQAFTAVNNDYIEIYNCYALESAVLETDDYRAYGKNPQSWSDLNLNRTLDWYDRRIMLYNDSTPYLTYAEMQSSDFLTKLNKNYQSGSSYKSFSTVTITEQGQNIDGKYSFPGNDTALQGLNYPFPTVLTQTDIFGSTVNLHYGRWPRIGLLWEENSQKLDLLADIKTKAEDSTLNDNENGKALLQTHLLVASSDVDTSAEPKIKLYDENRNELTNDKAAATVSRIVYNRENNCYDVTFIGQNVGTVVAEAKLGNYIARLTIEVTASLKLEASSTNISVYSGDTDTITLTVKDANDKQLLAETEKTLRWEIAVDNNGVQQDVIECSKDDIKLNADGTFSLPLTGFAAGEATVSITCTYPYGAATAAEPAKEVTATLYISATTKPSDVLGLTNGSVYNQISLPHTPKKSTTSYTGTTVEYPENGPAMQGSALFLYATDAYTDLKNGFTVDQIEITAGETTYTVGKDGITTDENHTYKVTVSDQWTTETNDTKFQYRAVKVESAAAGEITLKIVLKNGDVTYNLTTPYTIASNTYTVKFLDTKGNILLTKTVDYGKKPELTEEDKAKLKADAELGYTCTWALSEIYADTEIPPTLKPNTYTIKFEANGGSGTMPDVSYAYDKIQTTDSLPQNRFTKETSTFKGWAVEAEGAVQYTDMSSIQSIVNSMAMENKTKLTLYAVWEDTAAGGETVEP